MDSKICTYKNDNLSGDNLSEDLFEYEEYYLIKGNNAYKFIIGKRKTEIFIKCRNYEITLNNNDLSILTKTILNTLDDSYIFIINTFEENNVILKDIITGEIISLILKIYVLNKQTNIEIILSHNQMNKNLFINELNNNCNKMRKDIDNLKNEINILKSEINTLKILYNSKINESQLNDNNNIINMNNQISNFKFDFDNNKQKNQNIKGNEIENKNFLIESYNATSLKLKGSITTIIILNNKKEIAICTTTGLLILYDIISFEIKSTIVLLNNLPNNTILDIIEFKKK